MQVGAKAIGGPETHADGNASLLRGVISVIDATFLMDLFANNARGWSVF